MTRLHTPPTGPEGRLVLAHNGSAMFPGVVDDGVFHRLHVNVDFGTGYDYVGVLFYGENGGPAGTIFSGSWAPMSKTCMPPSPGRSVARRPGRG